MFAFRCDNDLAQIAALRAGLGIAACQYGIARRDPALVPILADQLRVRLELWVVMHENLKKEQKVKLMFDHLVERLAKYVEETEPS
jgi:DNA-binding transcriptional LysR family regulator